MSVLGLGHLGVEQNIGTAGRASTKVLLAECVSLSFEGGTSLWRRNVSITFKYLQYAENISDGVTTYQLVGERDLLELHLVNYGLGGARKGRGD